jgi:hypothetical protein
VKESPSGQYWADCKIRQPNPETLDKALVARVWNETVTLLGL